jgi:hypothetical protein
MRSLFILIQRMTSGAAFFKKFLAAIGVRLRAA